MAMVEPSAWISYVQEVRAARPAGQLIISHGGKPVELDWFFADLFSDDLRKAKLEVASLAAQITAADEMTFLRAHPKAVSQEMYLRACAPLLEQGLDSVDWQKVEETIHKTVVDFYSIDVRSFGDALKPYLNDALLFVSLKENQHLLGFMIAAVTPAMQWGDIKLITLILDPAARGGDLEKLVLGSIFQFLPKVERIFTGIRPTAERQMMLLESLGFKPAVEPIVDPAHKFNPEYFTVLEYRASQSSILQNG